MQDLKITLIQSDLVWEDPARNLALFSKLIKSAGETDVIVLPEMFSTGFSMNAEALAEVPDGPTMQWMHQMAEEKDCCIVGSLIILEGDHYYNRLIWMFADGHYEKYDKRHLFSLAGEEAIFTAGWERLLIEVKGWSICPLICYDLRFPVWSRFKNDYDVLIYVANWPEKRVYAWQQLLIARAIENQCYTIGVNRIGADGNTVYHSGNSAIIDPMGQRLWECEHERAVYTHTLNAQYLNEVRTRLPFQQDRDMFSVND
jgi:omega-amidase